MNTIPYPPNSIGARLWPASSGAGAPILIPREVALSHAQPAEADRGHRPAAIFAAAAVAVLALLVYVLL